MKSLSDKKNILYKIKNSTQDNILLTNSDGSLKDSGEKLSDYAKLTDISSIGESTTDHDITVIGLPSSVGNLSNGTIIPQGKTLTQILEQILIKEVAPTYNSPTLSINTGTLSFEVGTQVSPTIIPTFNQNDSGSKVDSSYVLKKNGTTISLVTSFGNYTDSTFTILDSGNPSYQASVSYNEGVIKNTNLGNPSPTGHILSGNISSNIINFSGYRKAFFGCSSITTVFDSSDKIRNLTNTIISPINGNILTLSVPVGTRSICFAYPITVRDCQQIFYIQTNDTNAKSSFAQTSVLVDGATSGSNSTSYRVYSLQFAIPTTDTITFQLTI